MITRAELLQTRYTKPKLLATLLLVALGIGNAHAADPGKGGGIYAKQCATCHGTSGISVMPGAPNFARGEKLMQPDAQLLSFIKAGKNAMPAYRGILSDADILDVIAYLRTLN
jgi:cytochrome c6